MSPETLTRLLRRQHAVFRGLLDGMEAALKAPGGDARVAEHLGRLLPLLAEHERAERELLFPAVLRHVRPADPRVLAMFERAHAQVHEKSDALRAALLDREASLGRLVAAADFIGLLREHLEQEEETLFPLADAGVPEAELVELAGRAARPAAAAPRTGRKR